MVDFQQIVDCIPQTITVLDRNGTTIYVNHAVLDYTGLTVADVTKPIFVIASFIQKMSSD